MKFFSLPNDTILLAKIVLTARAEFLHLLTYFWRCAITWKSRVEISLRACRNRVV